MATDAIRGQLRMKTPQASRLHVLARLIDELDKNLDQVEFLKDDIVDKRKYEEVMDLSETAQAALRRTRDSLAKHGGSTIAKGYK